MGEAVELVCETILCKPAKAITSKVKIIKLKCFWNSDDQSKSRYETGEAEETSFLHGDWVTLFLYTFLQQRPGSSKKTGW